MSGDRIVIVGSGPAALSCARSYRKHGGTLPVLMLGDDPDPPYERPPLSKDFLRGETERKELPLEPASFFEHRRIELRTGSRVVSLDAEAGVVATDRGDEIPFAECVLATGARPAVPGIPGVESDLVLTLRWIADSERLRSLAGPGSRVLVIGSGFIGCEAAISLARLGADVKLATNEESPQIDRLGAEVGKRIAGWLGDEGVELMAGLELEAIETGDGEAIAIVGGREIEADVVLLALGVERNGELGAAAGLKMDEDAIRTDERMRTSAAGVLAAGDVAMAFNPVADRPLRVEHWGEALEQGAVAGATLAGSEDERWARAPGFWSSLGDRAIKYVAWGDGYEDARITEHSDGGFTVHYMGGGELVGVLTHGADDDYQRGRTLVEARVSWT